MEEVKIEFKLPEKRVVVEPIVRDTPFLPKGHAASFLANNAKFRAQVPKLRNGDYVNVLTNEEKAFFEDKVRSGLSFEPGDLSIHDKSADSFWAKYVVTLGKEATTLDLSSPTDYILYKVLLHMKDHVAHSREEINWKATYRYVLVDLDDVVEKKADKADIKERAWEVFGELKSNRAKMIDVLKVYGRRAAPDSSDSFLKSEIMDIIESLDGARKFLEIADDPNFDVKLLIEKAIEKKILFREKNKYVLPGGDTIAHSKKQAVDYLSDPKNQDTLKLLMAQLNE